MKRVALFFGGISPEHEISILSALQVLEHFKSETYEVLPVYVSQEGDFYSGDFLNKSEYYRDLVSIKNRNSKVDIVRDADKVFILKRGLFTNSRTEISAAFLSFHGAYGEGGGFQGFCETLGLPYTSSAVLGSAICMNKTVMKHMLATANIPLAKGMDFTANIPVAKIIEDVNAKLTYPLFVKPANGGSSIGVSKVISPENLANAIDLGLSFDDELLIEEAFEHQSEVNISCSGSWNGDIKISLAEEVFSESSFLDFENKYLKGSKSKKAVGKQGMAATNRKIPAELPAELLEDITNTARKAFIASRSSGVVRIDFLVNKEKGKFVLVEVNSIPGSLAYYLWEASKIEFSKLINSMIDNAVLRKVNQAKYQRLFAPKIFKKN